MQENSVVEKTSVWEKLVTLVFVWTPPFVFLWGIVNFWNTHVDTLSLALLFSFILISGLGVTVGFHRHFTHGSFKTYPFVRYVLAVLGMFAAEKPVLAWVAFHRVHHKYSDTEGDPHSPHLHGGGWWGVVCGFYRAHMGWFSKKLPDQDHYIRDLLKDRGLVRVSALFPLWVLVGFLLPALIAFLITGSTRSAFLGFIWGGVIRMGFVYHMTWSVNSICHIWGARRFNTTDKSKNNWFFGLVGFGEGWHNNHHAIQTSARHGFAWYELDLSWYVIYLLKRLHLAWDVRVPSPEEILRVRRKLAAAS